MTTRPTSPHDLERLSDILARVAEDNEANTQKRPSVLKRAKGLNWTALLAVFVFMLDAGVWYLGSRAGIVSLPVGADYTAYTNAAASWLAGGPFYHPYQFTPYQVWEMTPEPILYPPTLLPLLVPFTVLPAVLWWIIPIGIVAYVVWRRRTWSRLALVAGLAIWPSTTTLIWVGNPGMWIVAMLALATIRPSFAPLVLLKPSLAPFALYRIRERGWWIGLGLMALVGALFGAMWLDWVTILLNSRQDQSLLYSLWSAPAMFIPLVVRRDLDPRLRTVAQLALTSARASRR